jgi:hypothetical protein
LTKDPAAGIRAPSEADHVQFAEKMREMFLPADDFPDTSRRVIGIVERGDFSLTLGRGKGLGLLSVFEFATLVDKQRHWERVSVLLRVPTSLVYVRADVALL